MNGLSMAAKICVFFVIFFLSSFSTAFAVNKQRCSNPRLSQHVIIDQVSQPYEIDEKYLDGTVIG